MEYIAEAQGLWYEGSGSWLRLIQGHPVILPFSIPGESTQMEYVFLEDYFNSSTRIRRGRLYELYNQQTWAAFRVSRYPFSDYDNNNSPFRTNRAYKTAELTVHVNQEIALGNNISKSHWMVVLSEKVGLEAHYLTLKSKTFLGILPETNPDSIPEINRANVLNALNAVVDSANIQAPQPVIDACRVAAMHILSAQYPDANTQNDGKTKELQKTINSIRNEHKAFCVADTAEIINKLHTRAKPNNDETRAASQRDAELAIECIAFLLQDFGWTA